MAANGKFAPSPKNEDSLKESHKTFQQKKALMSFRNDADLESNIKDQALKVRLGPPAPCGSPGLHAFRGLQAPQRLDGASYNVTY